MYSTVCVCACVECVCVHVQLYAIVITLSHSEYVWCCCCDFRLLISTRHSQQTQWWVMLHNIYVCVCVCIHRCVFICHSSVSLYIHMTDRWVLPLLLGLTHLCTVLHVSQLHPHHYLPLHPPHPHPSWVSRQTYTTYDISHAHTHVTHITVHNYSCLIHLRVIAVIHYVRPHPLIPTHPDCLVRSGGVADSKWSSAVLAQL